VLSTNGTAHFFFPLIKPRRDERPHLVQDPGRRHKQRHHQRNLYPDDGEAFHRLIDDQNGWIDADFLERVHGRRAYDIPKLVGEHHAQQKRDSEALQRADNPVAHFLQVLEERHAEHATVFALIFVRRRRKTATRAARA